MRIANPDLAESRTAGILNAAMSCFAKTGFHAASMREIAKEAGISPALLYRYFNNKESIIAHVAAADTKEFEARLAQMAVGDFAGAILLEFIEKEANLRGDPFNFALTCEIMAEASRNSAVAAVIRQNIISSQVVFAKALEPTFGSHDKALAAASYFLGLIDVLATHQFMGLDFPIRRAVEMAVQNPALFFQAQA